MPFPLAATRPKKLVASAAAAGAGNDAFTTVLLHFDGANNSTSIVDSNAGGSAHTWTCNVNAQQKTAAQKFGTASGFISSTQDGTRSCIQTPDHADWHFGSGDFTVDFWFKDLTILSDGNPHYLFWCGPGSPARMKAIISDTTWKKVTSSVRINGTNYTWEGSISIGDTNWHHYALVRTGNTLMMFIDGVNTGTNQTVSGAADTTTYDLYIGSTVGGASPGLAGTSPFPGYIDEFRISKGVARWTANFTPPVAAYS